MPSKKILIVGYGRHGKDSVAEILRDEFGLSFISSSLFAAERVMMPYFDSIGVHYDTAGDCYDDRHTGENRALWHKQIMAYNSPDKRRLAREILAETDMYVGMRSEEEFAAARDLFDHIVWVDASKRGIPPEPKSSMTIEYDPEIMDLIENDGSLGDLRERTIAWAQSIGLEPELKFYDLELRTKKGKSVFRVTADTPIEKAAKELEKAHAEAFNA